MTRSPTVVRAAFACALAICTGLGGCGQKADSGGKGSPIGYDVPRTPPQATYVTRAELKALPTAASGAEIRAHHEAVDDFKDKSGKVVGMGAMEMGFPLAKSVRVDGLKVGDKVEITWSVWWDSTPAWLATSLRKLPDDTKLEFRAAKHPG